MGQGGVGRRQEIHIWTVSASAEGSQEGSIRKPKGDCRLPAIFSASVLSVRSLIFTVLYSIFHWSKSAGGRLFDSNHSPPPSSTHSPQTSRARGTGAGSQLWGLEMLLGVSTSVHGTFTWDWCCRALTSPGLRNLSLHKPSRHQQWADGSRCAHRGASHYATYSIQSFHE